MNECFVIFFRSTPAALSLSISCLAHRLCDSGCEALPAFIVFNLVPDVDFEDSELDRDQFRDCLFRQQVVAV